MSYLMELGREAYLQKLAEKTCPGSKIRSKGKGKGLGRGRGKGPMGKPYSEEEKTAAGSRMVAKAVGAGADLGTRMARGNSPVKLDASKLLVGGALLLGIGGALERAGRAGYRAVTKGRNLNKALEFDPEAKKLYKTNPGKAEAAYNTLHKFNPEAASDPLVASSWIRQTMEQPILPVASVGEVVKARPKPVKSPFESAASEGSSLIRSGVMAAATPEA